MNATRRLRSASLFVLFLALSGVAAAQSGRVVGTVTEGGGNTLPGANVVVAGTTIGAATDVNGRFTIVGAPAGEQTIVASFVGFQSDSAQVTVPAGGEVEVDLSLSYGDGGIQIEITGQALGQQTAINEQLNAQTITNVVSAERIRELPDENAATAVSRLPGVSLQNGDQIVVRGIEAKYNTITVNGIQLPSTTTDRSTSLGFISSNMLAGIEVSKAVTPAMDANSIGGNVNLRLQEAPEGLHFDTMLQGDYNDQDNTADNYRAWASVSNRFLGERLGVFVQGNARRFNGGGDIGSATWAPLPQADVVGGRRPYGIQQYNFQDQVNVDEEVGGSLLLDFRLPGGKLILQNAYSAEEFDNATLTDRLLLESGNRTFLLNRTVGSRFLLVNSLQGEHLFERFGIDWSLSHSRSRREDDLGYQIDFAGTGYFEGQRLENWTSEEQIFDIEFLSTGSPGGVNEGITTYEDFGERRLAGALNLTVPVTVGLVTGEFKGGGKYTQLDRDRDLLQYYRRLADSGENSGAAEFLRSIGLDPTPSLQLQPFLDPDYDEGRGQYFLSGRRAFSGALNIEYLDRYFRDAQTGWPTPAVAQSNRFDYTANEEIAAGYLMADLDFGRFLNLLGGVRYENFSFGNTAPFVNQTLYDGQGAVFDTVSVDRSIGQWFPNIQAQIRPTDWFDIRLAYTKTTSRPDYQSLLASSWVNQGSDGAAGNPNLLPTISDNYDAYLSFHNNRIGLFTVGVFAKNLSNVIRGVSIQRQTLDLFEGTFWAPVAIGYPTCDDGRVRRSCEDVDGNGSPDGQAVPDINPVGLISTFVNNPDDALLTGFEVDWQTNFWYLPGVLRSIVFNVNYTRLNSEMDYQSIFLERTGPFSPQVQVDTVRTGRLFQQGEDVLNVALGADIGGFSGRVSFRYQGDILVGLDQRDPALDTFAEPRYGWDFSLRQRLPIDGLSLFLNGVNLSHPAQNNNRSLVVGPDAEAPSNAITQIAYYPRRFQLGLRYGL
ncbi:TonB-dependent receptor [Rubrivirga marina]|uniref:TonB-dependent receptor n=2 Tax=Rubrivirga marina TaxID=1196024 RepID=A0A271J5G3_9BACT|nr:TonB-dependent receptor [Rubrivirga marina]